MPAAPPPGGTARAELLKSLAALAKAVLAAAATLIVSTVASPARADPTDEADYLKQVQAKLPVILARYGPQQVLAEGYRICAYERVYGDDLSHEINQIIFDMPMDRHDAIQLETLAVIGLDCVPPD